MHDRDDDNDGLSDIRDADGDDDGLEDGDEDTDGDGTSDEDEDDDDGDRCLDQDEDEGDRYGTIVSFDAATGRLEVLTLGGATIVGTVNGDTEIEIECADDDSQDSDSEDGDSEDCDSEDGSAADLVAGAVVAELEFDDETGFLEEVAIYRS